VGTSCLQAIRILTLEPERLKNRSTTPEKEYFSYCCYWLRSHGPRAQNSYSPLRSHAADAGVRVERPLPCSSLMQESLTIT
jgi:hypothetical protein